MSIFNFTLLKITVYSTQIGPAFEIKEILYNTDGVIIIRILTKVLFCRFSTPKHVHHGFVGQVECLLA